MHRHNRYRKRKTGKSWEPEHLRFPGGRERVIIHRLPIDRHIDWKGGTIMFKKYVKQFLTDESGMELLQLAIVVVITVGLIGVMTKLMNTVRENISKANDNANTEMQGILRDANSDS